MAFQIKSDEKCQAMADRVMHEVLSPANRAMREGLSDCEMTISTRSTDIDASGMGNPYYVSEALRGSAVATMDAQRVFAKNPESTRTMLEYNRETGKYNAKLVCDSTRDSLNGPLVGAQALSPAGVSWINRIFTKPLIWSPADKYVSINTGTDPYAEVMSIQLADFAGFAGIGSAGALSNENNFDVEAGAYGQSSTIINISVSYKLTFAEQERARSAGASPFAGQMITKKQEYARWVLDIAKKYLIIYGNSATGTQGLLTVNGVTAWPYATIDSIEAGASATKGSDAYQLIAKALSSFLTTNQNMIDRVVIAMSVNAYNKLAYMPYSSVYNPKGTLEIMRENFKAGIGLAKGLDVEIVSDPLIGTGPNNFNTLSHDYLLFLAPDIINGLDGERQPLILFGAPIPEMVMPSTPNGYVTEIKTFGRFAGVFAPYTPAIQAWSGFGS